MSLPTFLSTEYPSFEELSVEHTPFEDLFPEYFNELVDTAVISITGNEDEFGYLLPISNYPSQSSPEKDHSMQPHTKLRMSNPAPGDTEPIQAMLPTAASSCPSQSSSEQDHINCSGQSSPKQDHINCSGQSSSEQDHINCSGQSSPKQNHITQLCPKLSARDDAAPEDKIRKSCQEYSKQSVEITSATHENIANGQGAVSSIEVVVNRLSEQSQLPGTKPNPFVIDSDDSSLSEESQFPGTKTNPLIIDSDDNSSGISIRYGRQAHRNITRRKRKHLDVEVSDSEPPERKRFHQLIDSWSTKIKGAQEYLAQQASMPQIGKNLDILNEVMLQMEEEREY